MADGVAQKPYELDRRYEAFTGGQDERDVYFAFRHQLGYDADEVDAMPWWKRRMYIEGLERHAARQSGDEPEDNEPDELSRLETMGVTVRRSG